MAEIEKLGTGHDKLTEINKYIKMKINKDLEIFISTA